MHDISYRESNSPMVSMYTFTRALELGIPQQRVLDDEPQFAFHVRLDTDDGGVDRDDHAGDTLEPEKSRTAGKFTLATTL